MWNVIKNKQNFQIFHVGLFELLRNIERVLFQNEVIPLVKRWISDRYKETDKHYHIKHIYFYIIRKIAKLYAIFLILVSNSIGNPVKFENGNKVKSCYFGMLKMYPICHEIEEIKKMASLFCIGIF